MRKAEVEHSLFHLGEVAVIVGTRKALPNVDLQFLRQSFADQPFESRTVLSLTDAGTKAGLVVNTWLATMWEYCPHPSLQEPQMPSAEIDDDEAGDDKRQ
jgi:hypothetical protein